MITISIELLTSFSISNVCIVLTCICDIITVVYLMIDFKRKSAARSTKSKQRLSVHRFSFKR